MPNQMISNQMSSAELPLELCIQSPAGAALRQIAAVVEQVQRVTLEAETLVTRHSLADLTARLLPPSWSVTECLDHLAQTSRTFLPALREAIANAPPLRKDRKLRIGMLAQMLTLNLEPPYRLRFKVLPQLAPRGDAFELTWGSFAESQAQLCEVAFAGAGLALDEVVVQSPLCTRIRYNAYAAFRILAAHERRHMWQIKQILKALDQKKNIAA